MVVFTFSVLDQKDPFWANLVEKIKIVSLSQNLVPRPIRICRTQWRCKTKVNYCPCDFTGVETLKQVAVFNTAFLFCWGECLRGLFLCTALKVFE